MTSDEIEATISELPQDLQPKVRKFLADLPSRYQKFKITAIDDLTEMRARDGRKPAAQIHWFAYAALDSGFTSDGKLQERIAEVPKDEIVEA